MRNIDDTFEDSTHPRTVAKVAARVFLAVVILATFGQGARVVWRTASTMGEPYVYDERWRTRTRAEVAALDSELAAARQAREGLEALARSRWFSRIRDQGAIEHAADVEREILQKRGALEAELAEHDNSEHAK